MNSLSHHIPCVMDEGETLKLLLENSNIFPQIKVDVDSPEYKQFIYERKFKLFQPKNPNNFCTPFYYVDLDGFNYRAEQLYAHVWMTQKYEVFDDDIVTASFPKTGSTWIQEIVWMISNNFDFETSTNVDLSARVPFVDVANVARPILEKQRRPRHYHCHAPYSLIPPAIREGKVKVIYVVRNPKDTCVSFYHLYKSLENVKFKGDFKEYARMFMEDELQWSPFDKHVLSYWEHRNDGHILIVSYEEMKKDLPGCIKKIAAFLSKPVSEEQVEMLAEHASFKSMAQSKTINREEFFHDVGLKDKHGDQKFMRKGIIGDWKNHFDDETNNKFDEWIQERFGMNGPTFVYE